jgi:hypothetical protein
MYAIVVHTVNELVDANPARVSLWQGKQSIQTSMGDLVAPL